MRRSDPDPWAVAAASAVAGRLRDVLGANLVGVYLHGSAVLGGFNPAISDLDVLTVCADQLSDNEADAIIREVKVPELPAKGLEMSVLTRSEALAPNLVRPNYQLHVAIGQGIVRRVDGRAGAGDRDLILHLAVSRASGHVLVGPAPSAALASIPASIVHQAMIDEIAWALEAAPPEYLVLTAARARLSVRTGRLVSKVEAGEADAGVPVVRAALTVQRGGSATVDPGQASEYVDGALAALRRDATDPRAPGRATGEHVSG